MMVAGTRFPSFVRRFLPTRPESNLDHLAGATVKVLADGGDPLTEDAKRYAADKARRGDRPTFQRFRQR